MKILSNKNVFEAALERINYLFDEFPVVVAGISGGKDSTVIYHLTMRVARERGRLPLPVFFLDQEAEWTSTIDVIRPIMYDKDVKPLWFQMPIFIENATSYDVKYLKCWDPENEADWLRPKEPISIKENTFGTPWFLYLFDPIFKQLYPGQKVAVLSGIRTEESPGRLMGLTTHATYKWITWGVKLKTKGQFTFYPIYDWSYIDVWHAIHSEHWPYNRVYDLHYQHGTPIRNMRVSNLHHETAVRDLFWLQEFDPELYERMAHRLSGVSTAGKLGRDFFVHKLPHMFRDWCEYRDFLIEKLTSNDPVWKAKLIKISAKWDKLFDGSSAKVQAARVVVQSIVSNDYNGAKLEGFKMGFVHLYARHQLDDIPWAEDKFARDVNPKLFDILRARVMRTRKQRYSYKQYTYRVEGDLAFRERPTG